VTLFVEIALTLSDSADGSLLLVRQ
jgi:hypothetical protein